MQSESQMILALCNLKFYVKKLLHNSKISFKEKVEIFVFMSAEEKYGG